MGITTFLKKNAPYWCAALHLVAAIGSVTLLRGGSEAVSDVRQRIAYMSEHPDRWRAGWVLWMLAAVSLAGFYVWWGTRLTARPPIAAFVLAGFGLVCDFAGESIFIAGTPAPHTAMDRTASLLTAGAGNGLYTLAAILLTLASPRLAPLLRRWAWLTWTSGIALTVFAIFNIPTGVVIASAVLMLLFIPWVVVMGATQ
jgi:hypothetical protein